jgi:hypothetical protein
MIPQTFESSILTNSALKIMKQPTRSLESCVLNSGDKILADLESHRRVITPKDKYDEVVGHEDIVDSIEKAFLAKHQLKTKTSNASGISSFLLVG